MAEVSSARRTSLERVTTGVGSVSRGARAKLNSLGIGRCDFHYLRVRFPWPFVRNCYLLTIEKCREILVTINVTITQCLLQYNAKNSITNQLAKQLKKAKVVSNIFLSNVHQQSTIAAGARSVCARCSAQRISTARWLSRLKRRRIHEGYLSQILHRSI